MVRAVNFSKLTQLITPILLRKVDVFQFVIFSGDKYNSKVKINRFIEIDHLSFHFTKW